MKIAEKVKEFFHNEGIHSTTIQPEFTEVCFLYMNIFLFGVSIDLLTLKFDFFQYPGDALHVMRSCLLNRPRAGAVNSGAR